MPNLDILPLYIDECRRQEELLESIEGLLFTLIKNIEAGYIHDINQVIEYIQYGMTLETFNMLALNINSELKKQIQDIRIGGGLSQLQRVTVH